MSEISTIKQEDGSHVVSIEGFIGEDYFTGAGNTAAAFKAALSRIPRDQAITVGINSEGGSIQEGLGIYNAIRERGNVTTRVDGYALSIASLIAVAGAKVISPKSSVWMIHNPWTITAGDSEEHRRAADSLEVNADVLASVLSEKTGKDKDEILEAMAGETWFSGEQAVEYGLADAMTDETTKKSALARTYRHPMSFDRTKAILNTFRAPKPEQRKDTHIMDTENKPAPAGAGNAPEPKAENIVTREQFAALQIEMQAMKTKAETERKARIEARCATLCAERNLDPAKWTERALKDETVMADIEAIKVPDKSPGPSRKVDGGGEGPLDAAFAIKDSPKRFRFMRDNWSELRQAEASAKGRQIMAANTGTDSATLIGSFLAAGIVTVLQNKCAALRALTRDFGTGPMAPRQPVVVTKVSAGGTAQTNATDFEDTTNFVGTAGAVSITPSQITVGGYIDNAELNSGFRIGMWTEIKAAEMADKLMAAVAAIITTGNFTATPHLSASASFGGDDMRTLWGMLKKANQKHLILDGEYYARLLPSTREEFNVAEASWPGWNGVFLNTVWTGATANTVGFACDPQAIAVAAGLPLTSAQSGAAGLGQSVITVPGVELSVQQNSWFSNKTRTEWVTWDVVFGAALLDATAGVLVKSS
jgi:ATP-dependent protease ClpP protease subunit